MDYIPVLECTNLHVQYRDTLDLHCIFTMLINLVSAENLTAAHQS